MSESHEQWPDKRLFQHNGGARLNGVPCGNDAPPAVQEMQEHRIKIIIRSSAIILVVGGEA